MRLLAPRRRLAYGDEADLAPSIPLYHSRVEGFLALRWTAEAVLVEGFGANCQLFGEPGCDVAWDVVDGWVIGRSCEGVLAGEVAEAGEDVGRDEGAVEVG